MARFRNTSTTLILTLAGLALSIPAHSVFAQGTTKTVAVTGQQAGGMAVGTKLNFFSLPVLNNAGQVAYIASLTGTGVNSTNDTALWRDNLFYSREGQGAWGVGVGINFAGFGSFVLNDAGQPAYRASLTGTGIGSTNDSGLWRDTSLVAWEGNTAFGFGTGTNFAGFSDPVFNNAGQVAYFANLTGTGVTTANDTGIWRDTALIAREGNPAFGIGGGVNFASFFNPVLNNVGQVTYQASLTGTGVDATNSLARHDLDRPRR